MILTVFIRLKVHYVNKKLKTKMKLITGILIIGFGNKIGSIKRKNITYNNIKKEFL